MKLFITHPEVVRAFSQLPDPEKWFYAGTICSGSQFIYKFKRLAEHKIYRIVEESGFYENPNKCSVPASPGWIPNPYDIVWKSPRERRQESPTP